MASAHVCSAVRDLTFSDHLAFAQHTDVERQLLRELDRAFTAAEEAGAASSSSSATSWKSYPQRKAEMPRAAARTRPPRRNSVGSVTSVGSAESRGLDNEGEWRSFLSGLDGAIQRAAAPSSSSSLSTKKQTQSRQAKTKSKMKQTQQQQQRHRRASLGRQTAAASDGGRSSVSNITDAADFSSASSSFSSSANGAARIYPDSRPRSALRKGKFHNGERLFVDAFLARSSSRRQTADFDDEPQPPERLRFDTPTIYHLSHEGALERTEVSWTAAVDQESSTSFVSLPKIRTSATTYSRMKRRQMQQMMMFQEQMQMKQKRRVPVRRNSLSSVAPVVADFRQ